MPVAKQARKFFTKPKKTIEIPDLIKHQHASWKHFVEEGLGEIFAEVNPVEDYTGEKLKSDSKTITLKILKCPISKLVRITLVMKLR